MSHTLNHLLRELEPEMRRIAGLAPILRSQVEAERKLASGDSAVDVVTAADYRLQEEFLKLFVQTELRHCRLWAEESSPALRAVMEQFDASNGLYLCLDPIDGTQRFVENSPYYSSIVSLHDGVQPLYSWIHYPVLDWWLRLDGTQRHLPGPAPRPAQLEDDLSRVVVYTAGDPHIDCPQWREELVERGYQFWRSREIGPYGAKYLLMGGFAGGYFVARPNPYDGLLAYHYALARGWAVRCQPEGERDFRRLSQDARGQHYDLRYLVLTPWEPDSST